jgi:hypothetical protein
MFEIKETTSTFKPGVNTNCKITKLELMIGEKNNRLSIEIERNGKKTYGSLWEPTSFQGQPIADWQERKVSEFITILCTTFITVDELKSKVENSINFADFITKALKAIDDKWQDKEVDLILTYQKNSTYLEVPTNLNGIVNKRFIKLSSDPTELQYSNDFKDKHLTKIEAPKEKVTDWIVEEDDMPF